MRYQHFVVSFACFAILGALFFSAGCSNQTEALTIYTSVDRDYAEPIIQAFKDAHPELTVVDVYDSELTKTTGLFNKMVQEARNPQADVFWNSEIIRTIQLKKKGLLQAYQSPSAQDIPSQFKDAEGFWTGFSARARVMIINTDLVPDTETPASIPALGKMKYKGKTAMAIPAFGTTATHMAALYTEKTPGFLKVQFGLFMQSRPKLLPGNATVRDEVARGAMAYGLTDTDDYFAAEDEGKPVRMAFLNQSKGADGTLLIPNTVAMLKGCANQQNAQAFIDYILSPEVETKLSQTRARQIPVRSHVPRPDNVPDISTIKVMAVDFEKAADNMEPCLKMMRETLHYK